MLKSLNKKGFTLVEVLCSLSVFSIIFICMVSFDVSSLNMKKDIKSNNSNVIIMENLKNNIIYSMSFIELEQLIGENRIFINKENMTIDKINLSVMAVFSNYKITQKPYIKLSGLKDELNVYKLTLELQSGGTNDIGELQCNFYKGDH